MTVKHPAPYSENIIATIQYVLDDLLPTGSRVCDPMAGIGGVHRLCGYETYGVELEPEWAEMHPQTWEGDATELPFPDAFFDGITVSPCMEQSHRVLTDDLRWVPVGDVEAGDRLIAFEAASSGLTANGSSRRRRWERTEVVRSVPKSVDCVRVILANGESVVTTPEHPWLADRYSYGGYSAQWIPSSALMGAPGIGVTRRHQLGGRQPYFVLKQLDTWAARGGYEAGWMAGMFDGEGSITMGMHGSPKMVLSQVDGPVLDRCEEILTKFGYNPNRIWRTKNPPTHQKIANLYVRGGFPGILKALGELRPLRLLNRWAQLDISSRSLHIERVAVVAVEPAGRRDIQEIETTTGTYFGDGYLMHNCYGNRMSDSHVARDGSYRRTYTHTLGRKLSPNNSGAMQWGQRYRDLHEKAWSESVRVLHDGGLFLLNCKDHTRNFKRVHVTNWHYQTLKSLGLLLVDIHRIPTPHFRFGANRDCRHPERLLVFVKPPADCGAVEGNVQQLPSQRAHDQPHRHRLCPAPLRPHP